MQFLRPKTSVNDRLRTMMRDPGKLSRDIGETMSVADLWQSNCSRRRLVEDEA